MSVQFQQNPQTITIEPNDDNPSRDRIPLNRLTSREERAERDKILHLFRKYDRDQDGYLGLRELKRMIEDHACDDLPQGLSKAVLKRADIDGDGKLDFDEFYKLAKEHNWIFRDICVKYCRYVVPSRNGPSDQTGPRGMMMRSAYMREQSVESRLTSTTTDGAYEQSMSLWPPPLTMIIFSIIEIIFFVSDILQNKEEEYGRPVGTSTDGFFARLFIYNPRKRHEAWRFVTYMFVHVGVMHIMMNLIVQIFLGVALELVHHWWRVALVYLAGVVAGSMGTSIASPHIYLAGASGGVYALITAHIATIIMNWKEMEFAIVQLFVFLVFCGTDIGLSIHRHLTDPTDRVGYMAHLCGAIAGLLVGIGVLRNLQVRSWEKKLWWFAVTLYISLMAAGICFHIFYPDYFFLSTYSPQKIVVSTEESY